jgi:hypothetical protein
MDKPSSERGNGNSLLSISSSPNSWVLYLGDTHHMASSDRLFLYLETYFGPPIFMRNGSPIEVCDRGIVDIDHG